MVIALGIFLLASLAFLGLLFIWSPGQPQPFLDENGQALAGSLSEKIHVPINGVQQGMFIKSKKANNPLLLFVHGGPGMPEYWLSQRYPTGLEDHFTVVWWEQRGAGLSYRAGIPPESMTAVQFIADTLEVTRYLLKRFDQEKIYLMAHSWGSYIGIQAAAQAPEFCIMPILAWGRLPTRSNRNNWRMNMPLRNTKTRATCAWYANWKLRHPG